MVWVLAVFDDGVYTVIGVYTDHGAAMAAQEKYYALYGQDKDIIWLADGVVLDQDQF